MENGFFRNKKDKPPSTIFVLKDLIAYGKSFDFSIRLEKMIKGAEVNLYTFRD